MIVDNSGLSLLLNLRFLTNPAWDGVDGKYPYTWNTGCSLPIGLGRFNSVNIVALLGIEVSSIILKVLVVVSIKGLKVSILII